MCAAVAARALGSTNARRAPPRPPRTLRARCLAAMVEYACDKKLMLGPTNEDLQDLAASAIRQRAVVNFHEARALLKGGECRRAVELLESAVEDGMPEAANDLGLLLYKGGAHSVFVDKARAAQLFEFAAQEGVGKAAHNFGFMLHRGDGVEQNKAKAAKLFEMAVGQGVAKSAAYLGKMFETGDGVRQDAARAQQLFQLAERANAAKRLHTPARE